MLNALHSCEGMAALQFLLAVTDTSYDVRPGAYVLLLTYLVPRLEVDQGVQQHCSSLLEHLPMVTPYVPFVQVQSVLVHAANSGELGGFQHWSQLLKILCPAKQKKMLSCRES